MNHHDVSLALAIFSVACFGIVLTLRIPELRARLHARRNRRRHPKLAKQYRRSKIFDRFIIAQEMLIIDRDMLRDRGVSPRSPEYPDVWDYHIPPGRSGWRRVRMRRKERMLDEQSLKKQFAL